MDRISVFWFRRDLRIEDNTGLFDALSKKGNVLPLFIFDSDILDKIEDKKDKRVSFIYDQIKKLKRYFEKHGSSILIKYGKPADVFTELIHQFDIEAVYTNHDYEPYARNRDDAIEALLKKKKIIFKSHKDQVIFEKSEITKDNGKPYTIFTPYNKKWRSRLKASDLAPHPSANFPDRYFKTRAFPKFNLKDTGFDYIDFKHPALWPEPHILADYHQTRDIPSINGTSRMSLHLRFGTISIRNLAKTALEVNEAFLNELIWREFYVMILWHFPKVVNQAFKPKYDQIGWLNDERHFDAWSEGITGYPIVDAGMRELNKTGYMHNRVRMIVASFLCKHLLIDWRWGEAYFAQKLLDYELSSNNGGWQWAAGSGCDAVPYFRIFNPELQTKKFDPEFKYIKKWIPEFQDLSYPKPVVEHRFARKRALAEYKRALSQ